VQQAQQVRQGRIQRLMQGPTILRNALLDTPLVGAYGSVGTVGEAFKFEDYLAIPQTAADNGYAAMPAMAQALTDKREEIDTYVSQMIDATLRTRAGPTSTHRYHLYQSLSEFCGLLKLSVQLGEEQGGHSVSYAVVDPARYQMALMLESCMPEIERGLRHAKERTNGAVTVSHT
jgi:hypothetical protein